MNPICIEEVLIISKEELDQFKLGLSGLSESSKTKYLKETDYIGRVQSDMYVRCSNRESGNIGVSLDFNYEDYDLNLGGNITFAVKSANHSVRDVEVEKVTLDQWSTGGHEWSTVLCTLDDVLNPSKNFIEDGKLTIHMTAMIFPKPSDVREKIYSPLGQFLWERQDDRDFVISVGKEGEAKTEIKIHKLILASRSHVFDRMLETDMKEKAENKLEITDFDPNVVEAAVDYFYDQETYKSITADHVIDLLYFADKYDINDLKIDMGHLLIYRVYPDTVCRIANASIIFNLSDLKDACVNFLNLYIKQKIPFDNAETLDEEIKEELNEETDADPENFYEEED